MICAYFPWAAGPPLSVVVNAAGITKDKSFLKMTEEAFDDVINVNLKVMYTVCRKLHKYSCFLSLPLSLSLSLFLSFSLCPLIY